MSTASKGSKRILVVNGHPEALRSHLCHALVEAYAEGAADGGHQTRLVEVSRLDFPILRSRTDWEHGAVPEALAAVQRDIEWAQHVVFVFPLWLGDMPALLKAFLEQVARPGFALAAANSASPRARLLRGRSARVVVTMGMPALLYRWYFRAHGVRLLKRNILGFIGFAPVRETLIGGVEGLGDEGVDRWLRRLRGLGRRCT